MVLVPCPEIMIQSAGTVQLKLLAPVPPVTVYCKPFSPEHKLVFPVIGAASIGEVEVGVTAKELARPTPQPLEAVTVTMPASEPGITTIEGVPWPLVITQLAGTVHK